MKELHLKKWVKVAIVAISILAICGLLKLLANFDKAEMQKCMDYGYSESYCRGMK